MNYFFLCLFFLSFFLRLCVAILCRFRFFPQGTDPPPVFLSIKIRFAGPLQYSVSLAGMTTAIYFFINYAREHAGRQEVQSARNSLIRELAESTCSGLSHTTPSKDLKKVICLFA